MGTNPDYSFGKWLKKRRKALDLTQSELAKQVGCATVTLQKIEADQRRPSKQMVEILAEQLGIAEAERQEFTRFARMEVDRNHFFFAGNGIDELRVKSAWGVLTNIPMPPTPLIGRDLDVTCIRKRLIEEKTHLLTLLGPPGVGKTRLAIQVAISLQDAFENGAHFIQLASVRDPKLVAAAIAQTLGVNQVGESSFKSRLAEYLRDKQMLLVLDNFEQVVSAAPFISDLLATCAWLSVLVTSRAPLSIRGEHRYPVRPLLLPDEDGSSFTPSELMRFSAIELFVERAQAVQADFLLDQDNAQTIAGICALLDGLPLAIELISVQIGVWPLKEILDQISRNQLIHLGGLRDVSFRHHTLHAAIDWSYGLLQSGERLMLSRLSVFTGGWSLEAAKRMMSDQPEGSAIDTLKVLADNHLIIPYEHHGEPRFTLLETIRAYAAERLVESGDLTFARQKHADTYLTLAEEAEPHLRDASQQTWLERLEVERGNFHTALTWFFDEIGDHEKGMRLAGALGWFWNMRSHVSESWNWLTRAMQLGDGIQTTARVKVLSSAGSIGWARGDLKNARKFYEECIILYRSLGRRHTWDLALALCGYCNVVMYQGDQDVLKQASEEAYSLFKEVEDKWGVGLALCLTGEGHLLNHNYPSACSSFEEAYSLLRDTGDKWATGIALMDWGYTHSLLGDLTSARARLEESIAQHQAIGERFMCSISLNILAQVVDQQDDAQQAIVLYRESLDLLRKMGIEKSIMDVQYNLACFVHAQGYYQLAIKLYDECLKTFLRQGEEVRAAECQRRMNEIKENC